MERLIDWMQEAGLVTTGDLRSMLETNGFFILTNNLPLILGTNNISEINKAAEKLSELYKLVEDYAKKNNIPYDSDNLAEYLASKEAGHVKRLLFDLNGLALLLSLQVLREGPSHN